jgi:hypothetical protein
VVAFGNGCVDTSKIVTVLVVDFPLAVISVNGDSTACNGNVVELSANTGAALSYQWFNNGVAIPSANGSVYMAGVSGNYTVEVTRQGLCSSLSDPQQVVIHPLPTIALQTPNGAFYCNGDSIEITATSNASNPTFEWLHNGTLVAVTGVPSYHVTQPGFYKVVVYDSLNCASTSDSVTINTYLPPFAFEEICAVTVDSATAKNVVVWEKTFNVRTASYNVYRESNIAGQYTLIGNVPFDSASFFVDSLSNPLAQSYRYKISVVDSCGQESALSSLHRTIHAASNIGANLEINLSWNSYEGVSYPTHNILRSDNNGPFVIIGSVSSASNTFTDLSPPPVIKRYLVQIAIPGGCNITGSSSRPETNFNIDSLGNIQSNRIREDLGVSVENYALQNFDIYPNPNQGVFSVVFDQSFISDIQIEIVDLRGRVVARKSELEFIGQYQNIFDFTQLSSGNYIIMIRNSRGLVKRAITIN